MPQLLQKEVYEQYRDLLSDWIPSGASVAIAVEDTFVYFASGQQQISLKVGAKVPEDSMAYRVIKENRKIEAIMDTSVFDTPYYGTGYPLTILGKKAAIVIILPPLFHTENEEELKYLTGKLDDEWIPVKISDVCYIESLQKRTWFWYKEKSLKTNVTLKELQLKLPNDFIRIHRSFIVNIRFISKITKDISSNYIIHLTNGTQLPISQSYISTVKSVLQI